MLRFISLHRPEIRLALLGWIVALGGGAPQRLSSGTSSIEKQVPRCIQSEDLRALKKIFPGTSLEQIGHQLAGLGRCIADLTPGNSLARLSCNPLELAVVCGQKEIVEWMCTTHLHLKKDTSPLIRGACALWLIGEQNNPSNRSKIYCNEKLLGEREDAGGPLSERIIACMQHLIDQGVERNTSRQKGAPDLLSYLVATQNIGYVKRFYPSQEALKGLNANFFFRAVAQALRQGNKDIVEYLMGMIGERINEKYPGPSAEGKKLGYLQGHYKPPAFFQVVKSLPVDEAHGLFHWALLASKENPFAYLTILFQVLSESWGLSEAMMAKALAGDKNFWQALTTEGEKADFELHGQVVLFLEQRHLLNRGSLEILLQKDKALTPEANKCVEDLRGALPELVVPPVPGGPGGPGPGGPVPGGPGPGGPGPGVPGGPGPGGPGPGGPSSYPIYLMLSVLLAAGAGGAYYYRARLRPSLKRILNKLPGRKRKRKKSKPGPQEQQASTEQEVSAEQTQAEQTQAGQAGADQGQPEESAEQAPPQEATPTRQAEEEELDHFEEPAPSQEESAEQAPPQETVPTREEKEKEPDYFEERTSRQEEEEEEELASDELSLSDDDDRFDDNDGGDDDDDDDRFDDNDGGDFDDDDDRFDDNDGGDFDDDRFDDDDE